MALIYLFILAVVAPVATLKIVGMVLIGARFWRTGRRRTGRRALILGGRKTGRAVFDEYRVLSHFYYLVYGNKLLALVDKLKALTARHGNSKPITLGEGYRNIAHFS